MLPTPSTSHINTSQIYEPSEDSYLLLDTLSSPGEKAFLSRRNLPSSTPLIVELGTGSGVVLAFLTAHAERIFQRQDILTLGIDINTFACAASRKTVQKAVSENVATSGSFLDVLQGDLTAPLRGGQIDVLIFNPPYVPTETVPEPRLSAPAGTFERDSHLLSLSYAGGQDGMEVTQRVLSQLSEILSARGVAYILLCAQNKPQEVAERMRAQSWCVEIVGSSGKTGGWEKLSVLRLWHDLS